MLKWLLRDGNKQISDEILTLSRRIADIDGRLAVVVGRMDVLESSMTSLRGLINKKISPQVSDKTERSLYSDGFDFIRGVTNGMGTLQPEGNSKLT